MSNQGSFDSPKAIHMRPRPKIVGNSSFAIGGQNQDMSLTKQLLLDEAGVVMTTELVLIATLGVLGVITGLTCVRQAVTAELKDVGDALAAVDQSYAFSGHTKPQTIGNCCAWTAGSSFADCVPTVCEEQDIVGCCDEFTATAPHSEEDVILPVPEPIPHDGSLPDAAVSEATVVLPHPHSVPCQTCGQTVRSAGCDACSQRAHQSIVGAQSCGNCNGTTTGPACGSCGGTASGNGNNSRCVSTGVKNMRVSEWRGSSSGTAVSKAAGPTAATGLIWPPSLQGAHPVTPEASRTSIQYDTPTAYPGENSSARCLIPAANYPVQTIQSYHSTTPLVW